MLTKLSGFLISCAMPAVSCPSAAIFCAWTRLACAICNSRNAVSAASRAAANGFLGALALGDVGIDQHEAAARYRVPAHLDDAAVGPRALEAHLPPGVFDGAAQLRFEIGRVLAAVSEIAEILGIARPPREEGVRQIEHLLEIAVPRGKARRGVEHDDAVAHIVKGDAQLGLAIAQLVEQSRILDRDHRLVGEGAWPARSPCP